MTVQTRLRPEAWSLCSHSQMPCQVPSASLPLLMGMLSDTPNIEDLQCAGMSSFGRKGIRMVGQGKHKAAFDCTEEVAEGAGGGGDNFRQHRIG